MLVVAMAVTVIVVPQPASGSVVGDVLGIVSGSGSEPPTPPESSPPQKPPPGGGGPGTLDRPVSPSNPLLPPESACPGESDPKLPPGAQMRVMRCLLSHARVAKGRSALRPFKPLRVSATHKARDIRRCQRLSHTACGRDPWYWVARVGFFKGTWSAGEILADGDRQRGTALGAMRRWLGSKPHRAVIFHPKFDLVGVGAVTGRFHGVKHVRIWVAHFGYRR
jgi:hypothetical protein